MHFYHIYVYNIFINADFTARKHRRSVTCRYILLFLSIPPSRCPILVNCFSRKLYSLLSACTISSIFYPSSPIPCVRNLIYYTALYVYKIYIKIEYTTCWNYSLGRIRSRGVFFAPQRCNKIGNCELRESWRAGGQSGEDTNRILLIWNAITMFCNSFSSNISYNYNEGAKSSLL